MWGIGTLLRCWHVHWDTTLAGSLPSSQDSYSSAHIQRSPCVRVPGMRPKTFIFALFLMSNPYQIRMENDRDNSAQSNTRERQK